MKEGVRRPLTTMSREREIIENILGISRHRMGERPISWLFPDAESVGALYEGCHGDDECPGFWIKCTPI